MNFYKQCDSRWGSKKLGTCSDTICQSGCFLCCLSMLSNIPPDQANEMLKSGGYINGCIMNSEKAAQLLGLEYYGISKTKPSYDCVAETNYYKSSGVPQHFFIIKADGSQVDPLGKSIVYPIVSYRLFKSKESDMLPQSEVNDRTFTYEGMGLVWVKPEWIGKDQNDTSKPFPNTLFQAVKPLQVKTEIKEIEKIVEVEKKLTDADKEKIAKEWNLAHPTETPPATQEEPQELGNIFVRFLEALKKFFERSK